MLTRHVVQVTQHVSVLVAQFGEVLLLLQNRLLQGAECGHECWGVFLQVAAVLVEQVLDPHQVILEVRGTIGLSGNKVHQSLQVIRMDVSCDELHLIGGDVLVHSRDQLLFVQSQTHLMNLLVRIHGK